jgi:hypothetical protein
MQALVTTCSRCSMALLRGQPSDRDREAERLCSSPRTHSPTHVSYLPRLPCLLSSGAALRASTVDGHPASVPFHDLLGGTFSMHSALAPATCTKTDLGDHPFVAQLAPAFDLTDEIYAFSSMRIDDQVVLTCSSSTDPPTVRPIAWFR